MSDLVDLETLRAEWRIRSPDGRLGPRRVIDFAKAKADRAFRDYVAQNSEAILIRHHTMLALGLITSKTP